MTNLQDLRDAASACTSWRDRLNENAYLAELAETMARQQREVLAEAGAGQGVHSFYLWSERSRPDRPIWSFDVVHEVERAGQATIAELKLRWVFERLRPAVTSSEGPSRSFESRVVAACVVDGTCLSFADELYRSFEGKLTTDAAGKMFLRESGLPFDLIVHPPMNLRLIRTLLAPYQRPLIILGQETSEEELLAQLCIFTLRVEGLIDGKGEVLLQIQRWLSPLGGSGTRGQDSDLVSEAAEHLLARWDRPMSARSFRDYSRRTLTGLVRDRLRQDDRQVALDESRDGTEPKASRGRGVHDDSISVDELARESGLSRRTLYRWLRSGRIAGGVETFTTKGDTALGLRFERTQRRYAANRAMVSEAKGLRQQRSLRRDLIVVLAKRRKTTLRGARALIPPCSGRATASQRFALR